MNGLTIFDLITNAICMFSHEVRMAWVINVTIYIIRSRYHTKLFFAKLKKWDVNL